jgi:hypothetical protein
LSGPARVRFGCNRVGGIRFMVFKRNGIAAEWGAKKDADER